MAYDEDLAGRIRVLHGADLSWQRDRSWCHTGLAKRRRKHGEVEVHDPDATAKRG